MLGKPAGSLGARANVGARFVKVMLAFNQECRSLQPAPAGAWGSPDSGFQCNRHAGEHKFCLFADILVDEDVGLVRMCGCIPIRGYYFGVPG